MADPTLLCRLEHTGQKGDSTWRQKNKNTHIKVEDTKKILTAHRHTPKTCRRLTELILESTLIKKTYRLHFKKKNQTPTRSKTNAKEKIDRAVILSILSPSSLL